MPSCRAPCHPPGPCWPQRARPLACAAPTCRWPGCSCFAGPSSGQRLGQDGRAGLNAQAVFQAESRAQPALGVQLGAFVVAQQEVTSMAAMRPVLHRHVVPAVQALCGVDQVATAQQGVVGAHFGVLKAVPSWEAGSLSRLALNAGGSRGRGWAARSRVRGRERSGLACSRPGRRSGCRPAHRAARA